MLGGGRPCTALAVCRGSLKSFLPCEAMRTVLFARETRFALEKVFVLVSHLCEGPGARGKGVGGRGRGSEGRETGEGGRRVPGPVNWSAAERC